MKHLKYLIILIVILFLSCAAVPCKCQAGNLAGIVGGASTTAPATTWLYPNSISTFTSDGGQLNTWGLASTIVPGSSVTITKLGLDIYTLGTSSECSVGIYDNGSTPAKYAGCHFTPGSGWNECVVSYAVDGATTYTLWSQCNNSSTTAGKNVSACTPYYSTGTYAQDMPATFAGRTTDGGCYGMRMGY